MKMIICLAQSDNVGRILMWVMILVVCLLALAVATLWVRRWMTKPDESAEGGFSLGDLSDLRRRGTISEEEYQRARGRLVAELKANIDRDDTSDHPPQKP
jgi:hypothetical protein